MVRLSISFDLNSLSNTMLSSLFTTSLNSSWTSLVTVNEYSLLSCVVTIYWSVYTVEPESVIPSYTFAAQFLQHSPFLEYEYTYRLSSLPHSWHVKKSGHSPLTATILISYMNLISSWLTAPLPNALRVI